MSIIYGQRLYIMGIIEHIRASIGQEIFDYTQLMHCLSDYSKPRDAVTKLLSQGKIIRIRKGLYCFGGHWRKGPMPLELMANLVYGPSVISLDYALSWYGLIPEQVSVITSVTTGRSCIYDTPVGNFSYFHLSERSFSHGITLQRQGPSSWLITQPLKALADKVWLDKRFQPASKASFSNYLFQDLRIDEKMLSDYITDDSLIEIKENFSQRKITWLLEFLEKKMRI